MPGFPKNICVYCGASPGLSPQYAQAAEKIGKSIARAGFGLVYGGGNLGLMGIAADAALAAGGKVIGVIPHGLADREQAHLGLTELIRVESLHERKAVMEKRAHAFLALPGGLGTLDELFEILTWSQLGLHKKPVGLLNLDGYYDSLLSFLAHASKEGFLRGETESFLHVEKDPERILAWLGQKI
jgi:uncharacterized protein (TIGR00730 family)